MTDDMVKNVNSADQKPQKKHNSISIRRQTQPTKNLKK